MIDEKAIEVFFKTPVAERLLKSERVLKEYEFAVLRNAEEFYPDLPDELRKEQVIIQGKLDCAFVENDGIVLIDYKTDNVSDENVLISNYRSQLAVYKSALEECLEMTVKETYIYSFKLNKFISVI